jgi:hypothetical protein
MPITPSTADGLAVALAPHTAINDTVPDLCTAPSFLPDGLWEDLDLNLGDDWALDEPNMSWMA